MADPGEGPAPPPSLFLDQTEARKAAKKSQGLNDPLVRPLS